MPEVQRVDSRSVIAMLAIWILFICYTLVQVVWRPYFDSAEVHTRMLDDRITDFAREKMAVRSILEYEKTRASDERILLDRLQNEIAPRLNPIEHMTEKLIKYARKADCKIGILQEVRNPSTDRLGSTSGNFMIKPLSVKVTLQGTLKSLPVFLESMEKYNRYVVCGAVTLKKDMNHPGKYECNLRIDWPVLTDYGLQSTRHLYEDP